VSQEKNLADYASGTYFIHPKLIEEMRQLQRQKHQLAREQGEVPIEQPPDPVSQKISQKISQDTLDPDKLPGEPASTPTSHTGAAHVQPTQK
jgi:hypothetical protein